MEQGLSYVRGKQDVVLVSSTIGELLEEAINKYENDDIIISREQNKKITAREFLMEIDNVAAAFYEIGLRRGEHIGIIVNNSLESLVVNFACVRGGFISVNLNPALQPRDLEHFLKTLKITCIVCVDKYKSFSIVDIVTQIVPEIVTTNNDTIESENLPNLKRIIVISEDEFSGKFNFKNIKELGKNVLKDTLRYNQKQINTYDTYSLLFTSGSTGNPKIVGITHHQMANSVRCLALRYNLASRPKLCFCTPLFHIFGLGYSLLAVLCGLPIILPSLYYNPEKNLEAISEEDCNLLLGTPTMFHDLINIQKKRNLNISPKIVITGGAAGSVELYKQIKTILKAEQLYVSYGLTETVAISSPYPNAKQDFVSTAVGYILDHIEAKVVDPDGNIVPIGTIGELLVRGYSIIKKYTYNDAQVLDEDGWFKTGDAIFIESDGRLNIVARLKDIINRGGEKVSPGEIEEILESHPDIIEVYVVGTYHERLGEEVCACLKLKPGSVITLDEIKNYCKGKLSYYKIPSRLEIMECFPKTSIGKIQKSKLVNQLNSAVQ